MTTLLSTKVINSALKDNLIRGLLCIYADLDMDLCLADGMTLQMRVGMMMTCHAIYVLEGGSLLKSSMNANMP